MSGPRYSRGIQGRTCPVRSHSGRSRCPDVGRLMSQIHMIRHVFPWTEKLPSTYCGRVSDTANYLDTSTCRQQVRATSRCNEIWETTRHNRHNGLLPAPTCYTDLLYGETGAMDFGLKCASVDGALSGMHVWTYA